MSTVNSLPVMRYIRMVSEWGNFHAWLEANPNLTGVKEIPEEFNKEYTKKEFFQYVGISRIG